MRTAKGTPLPDDLAATLNRDLQLVVALDAMRPSCQRGYVEWIDAAATPDQRALRVERVLIKIGRWGARHGLVQTDPPEFP